MRTSPAPPINQVDETEWWCSACSEPSAVDEIARDPSTWIEVAPTPEASAWMNMQASWELDVAEDQSGNAVEREVLPRTAA